MGIQSFIDEEAANSGRPQPRATVDAALELLLSKRLFPTVNLDLIYGLPGQTVETWLYSVRFTARELWGEDAEPDLTVSIDAWEGYLDPVDAREQDPGA